MNLSELYDDAKEVSAKAVLNLANAKVTSIQILADGLLKEHQW
jgi:hypothetical protein